MIGDAAGDGGEVRVSGREEVELYLRGKDVWRERRGKDGGETGLEEPESCKKCCQSVGLSERGDSGVVDEKGLTMSKLQVALVCLRSLSSDAGAVYRVNGRG